MIYQAEIGQVKKVLRAGIDNNELAGANLMVIKDGNEILYHEDGYADREEKLPVKRDSIFRLYSMSKPVTAAAVMILLERGEIDLYDPVSRFLPGFKNQMVAVGSELVPAQREVNIKDLLSMTSGLLYGGGDRAGQDTEALFRELDGRLLGDSPMSTIEAMNKLGKCALAFQPGSAWQYGTSADVLGAVVEVASGLSYGEFLDKELFKPLGMQDTAFWVPAEKRDRLVKTYARNEKEELVPFYEDHLGVRHKMDRIPAFESGGAGLASTIDDYAKFAKMLMNEGSLGNVGILRPRTVKYLTSCTLNAEQQKTFDLWVTLGGHSYGNQMRVMTDPSQAGDMGSLGEYGWDGWLGAYFCNCPKDNLTFILMMQRTDAGTTPLTRKIRNIILSAFI
ncbi:MAG: beta-lactamase [Eubacterium sp.]|jgi:CubicO group peptidase (beta-lactamase class C family)|nr:beta-lactamase [Eubacterium sp.]